MPRTPTSWFKFYPDAWMADTERRSLSRPAQGWYMDVICLLWESPRPGYGITPAGRAWNAAFLSMMLGDTLEEAQKYLSECLEKGVLKVEKKTGIFYQKRTVEEYELFSEKSSKERDRKRTFARNIKKTNTSLDAEMDAEIKRPLDASLDSPSPVHTRARALSSPLFSSLLPSSQSPLVSSPTEPEVSNTRGREADSDDDEPWDEQAYAHVTGYVAPVSEPLPSARVLAREQARRLVHRPNAIPGVPTHASDARDAATGQPESDSERYGELLVEIGLATPAAEANGWTTGIEQNTTIMSAIIGAVETESREQGLTNRDAALWLLKQTRSATQAVMREVGWQKFWTLGRAQRFFANWEYRKPERFEGGKDGAAGAESKRRVAQVQRGFPVGSKPTRDEHSGARDAGSGVSTGTNGTPEPSADGGSVPRRVGGADTGGAGSGVQPGGTGEQVRVSESRPTRRVFLPE